MKPNAAIDPLVAQLRALEQKHPDLQPAAVLYEIILPSIRDADLKVVPAEITPEQARSKLGRGLPLLHALELTFDHAAARELILCIAAGVEKSKTAKAHAAHEIRAALEKNRLNSEVLFTLVASTNSQDLFTLAKDQKLDGDLLWTLARHSLKPAFRAWQRQLASCVHEVDWEKGACFVCGVGATLAELRGNDQEKHLRCGQCGADWMFRRIACMYCHNDDPKRLGFFQLEKGGTVRVETCENCKGYLKIINSFAPNTLESIVIQDLATLPFDYIAREKGYARAAFP